MLKTKLKSLFYFILIFSLINFWFWVKIYFEPSIWELIKNCENKIDIMIDPEWKEIVGASINIKYDNKNISIEWFFPNEEFNLPIEHKEKNWYFEWWLLSFYTDNNKKRYGFKEIIKYWTLNIKNKENIKETKLTFKFEWLGRTKDKTDVYRISDWWDILDSIQNWKYTFVNWNCLWINNKWKNMLWWSFDFNKNLERSLKILDNEIKKEPFFKKNYIYIFPIIILIAIIILILNWKKQNEVKQNEVKQNEVKQNEVKQNKLKWKNAKWKKKNN